MIRILIEATLGEIWIEPECEGELSDAEFLELVNEDIPSLLENARWRLSVTTANRDLNTGLLITLERGESQLWRFGKMAETELVECPTCNGTGEITGD